GERVVFAEVGCESGGRDLDLGIEFLGGGDGLAGGVHTGDLGGLQGVAEFGLGDGEPGGGVLGVLSAGADGDAAPAGEVEVEGLRAVEAVRLAGGETDL